MDRPPEKFFRILNVSGQTLYVLTAGATLSLPPGGHADVPVADLGFHVHKMAKRGHIALFEKD